MGPDTPPKPIADVIKWAQRIFGKFCKLHRMGPDMPPKPLLMLINGPSVSWEVLQITLGRPSGLLRGFVNNIGWAKTCRQNPLLMLLNGPSVFSGSAANYIGWSQRFTERFCQ